jgi:hypothetical protein
MVMIWDTECSLLDVMVVVTTVNTNKPIPFGNLWCDKVFYSLTIARNSVDFGYINDLNRFAILEYLAEI